MVNPEPKLLPSELNSALTSLEPKWDHLHKPLVSLPLLPPSQSQPSFKKEQDCCQKWHLLNWQYIRKTKTKLFLKIIEAYGYQRCCLLCYLTGANHRLRRTSGICQPPQYSCWACPFIKEDTNEERIGSGEEKKMAFFCFFLLQSGRSAI